MTSYDRLIRLLRGSLIRPLEVIKWQEEAKVEDELPLKVTDETTWEWSVAQQ